MCRGFEEKERERLIKIKAFYVHLSFSSCTQKPPLYDSLTLHFLPRINGGSLEIDGFGLRPDTAGFITLHRVVSSPYTTGIVIYGSRERIGVSEGSRFGIYANDVKILKGIFRKDERGEKWKLDCTCQLEGDEHLHLQEADVCVEVEGHGGEMMTEKVRRMRRRRRRRRSQRRYCSEGWLEEIPEEREVEREFDTDGCCCCCSDCDGKTGLLVMEEEGGEDDDDDREVEGVKWAVDVGIWVMCLGVGYLVSKASLKRITRPRRLF